MKLNPFDIDIQPDELARLNTPDSFKNSLSYDDVQLSKDLPIVVKYDQRPGSESTPGQELSFLQVQFLRQYP